MLVDLQPALARILEEAKGTYGVAIYHFESDQSFFHNEEETFYAASIIKVPIMAAVFDEQLKGNLSLDEKIVVRAEDMVTGSGILQNLTPGIEMSIYDLIVLMIIESDNTATNLLVDRVGVGAIQNAMAKWGCIQSRFHHKLQIIPAERGEGSNVISAAEMTRLMANIARGNVVSWNAGRKMVEILKQQKFNDGLPSLLPPVEGPIGAIPQWEMAHKTGFVTGIEHDVALFYLPGHTFSVSVLGKDIPDRADAKQVMGQIGKTLYETASVHSNR